MLLVGSVMCSMALDCEHFGQENFFWFWFAAQLEQEDPVWWQRFSDTGCNNHHYIFVKILEKHMWEAIYYIC